MKKIFKSAVVLTMACTILNGCSNDFLEADPKGMTPQEEYYKTNQDALEAIASTYDILQGLYAVDWTSLWLVKTLPADEIIDGGGKAGDQIPLEEISNFSYSSANIPISNCYKYLYNGVYRANMVIDYVATDTPEKTAIVGEALFLRAYYYFELTTMFGRVPLIIHELDINNSAQPQATVEALWLQIETDLAGAIEKLPTKSEWAAQSADFKFRVSKGTAQALLGKALLYQEEFPAAAVQFQAVIDSKEYGLEPNFATILKKETEFGQESLFEVGYVTTEGHTWGNGTFAWGNPRRQENNITFQLCGPRGDGWFDGGTTGLIAGWGFAYPLENLNQAFLDANDVTRRQASVLSESELLASGGKIKNNGEYPWDWTGFVRLKYGTWASETNTTTQAELNYGTNFRLIRYADVLLMAAEAYNKSGNDTKALEYLNDVRDRVDLPDLASAGDALFADIVKERRLELAFEGHRFADLVRWDLASTVLGDGTGLHKANGYTAKNALYPIPEEARSANQYLEQNTGY